ncbi:MAG: hypothetical protein GQ536_09490 [Candidatus Aminicenantes bacterium]|nr:hypothetical protein [Candidatus Aminicenantes bacterium]
MNNQANLDYSRAEVATDARRRPMKLWLSTANGSQRSRCGKIGSPEGEKMPIGSKKKLLKKAISLIS